MKANDTPSQIAECFGVPLSELRRLNRIRGGGIIAGQQLVLPATASAKCSEPEKAPAPKCKTLTSAELAQLERRCVHRVRRGETMGGIADRASTTIKGLQELNNCDTEQVLIGQWIRVCNHHKEGIVPKVTASEATPPSTSPVDKETPDANGQRDPSERTCLTSIGTQGDTDAQVLLVNGDGPTLFQQFVDLTRTRGRTVDWKSLTVYVYEPNAAGVTKLRWSKPKLGEALMGVTAIGKWKRILREKRSEARGSAAEDALGLHSDLVCGE